jgi:hypothetical protein
MLAKKKPMRFAVLLTGLLVFGPGCSSHASSGPAAGSGAAPGDGVTPGGSAGEPAQPGSPAALGAIENPNGTTADPGSGVSVSLSAQGAAELGSLQQQLEQVPSTFAALQAAHPFMPRAELGYDPSTARNLDLIQRSSLALSAAELETVGKRGLVISSTRTFPSFGDGYAAIYTQDLPLYVSADSILEAVHRSYDTIPRSPTFTPQPKTKRATRSD